MGAYREKEPWDASRPVARDDLLQQRLRGGLFDSHSERTVEREEIQPRGDRDEDTAGGRVAQTASGRDLGRRGLHPLAAVVDFRLLMVEHVGRDAGRRLGLGSSAHGMWIRSE